MSNWKASKVFAALLRLGWVQFKQVRATRRLRRPGWKDYTFSFSDGQDLGPAALARISHNTGVRPEDV